MTRRPWRIVAFVAAAVMISACTDAGPRTLPPPSSTSSTAFVPPTSQPDFSRVVLEPVAGATTTVPLLTVGTATLQGSVQGPDGGVPGAVVRADRIVGSGIQRSEVQTGPDGTFTLARVPGGRFRVRAFLPPTLAMDDAEVFYLADGEVRDLRLIVQSFTGLSVRASTAPRGPIVGQAVNLAVRVSQRTVDGDGVAREVPLPNEPVRVSASGWTSLDGTDGSSQTTGSSPTTGAGQSDDQTGIDRSGVLTDSNGVAVFRFRCDRVTEVSAFAVVGAQQETFPLQPPPCSPVPTTTTTTTTTPATGDSSTTTTSEG